MKIYEKVRNIEEELNGYFVEREEVIHGLILAILSENNMLLLGPPGVAKSLVVRALRAHIENTNYFEWLLTKFSTPEEIFGPLSLKALEDDRYSRITYNKMPEAHFAFLDEIFKCNSGMLNSLLPVLNEKKFHNDGKAVDIPLLATIGASNEIPDSEDGLEALYDRFLLKFMVKPIQEESGFKRMVSTTLEKPTTVIDMTEVDQARAEVKDIDLNEGMVDILIKLRRVLGSKGIYPTDRTFNTCTKILRAEAWINGRDSVVEDDFTVLRNVLWTDPEEERMTLSIIFDLVSPEKGQIIELFEEAKEIAEKTLSEKNDKKRVEKGIDTSSKLKVIKKKIGKLIDTMEKKNKDTKEAKAIETKLTDLFTRVFSESIGITAELD